MSGLNDACCRLSRVRRADGGLNFCWPGTRTKYTYDVENRLLSASGTNLTYDPLGRLYSTPTTTFIYDGDRIAGEYSGGSLAQRYVYGGSGDDPIVWYEGSSLGASDRQYLLADEEGSIIDVTGSAGNVLAVNQYHPYGLGSSLNLGRFQFTGQANVPEVGLYYYKARMYNPTLGRFMQTDPIGYTDDLDVYSYVGNDPIDRSDPTGDDAVDYYYGAYPCVQSCQQPSKYGKEIGWATVGLLAAPIAGVAIGSSEAAGALATALSSASKARLIALGLELGARVIIGTAERGFIEGAEKAATEELAGSTQSVARDALEEVTENGAKLTEEIEKDIGRVWGAAGGAIAGHDSTVQQTGADTPAPRSGSAPSDGQPEQVIPRVPNQINNPCTTGCN